MASLKSIEKVTLKDMINHIELYSGLPEGLKELPLPEKILNQTVPLTLQDFTKNLCYGQRLFIVRKEDNDFGSILRLMDAYFYPLVKKTKWDEQKALLFGKKVLNCKAIELYPVSMHLITLIAEMVTREQKLLHREPSQTEKAAEIEKLNKFSELNSILFLRDSLKLPIEEVLLTSYDECLVHFMLAKETADFQNRYFEIQKAELKSKK